MSVLISELRDHLSQLATSESNVIARGNAIRLICAELADAGLDAESLIRYGMPSVVATPVISWLVLEPVLGESPGSRPLLDFDRWRSLLGIRPVAVSKVDGQLRFPDDAIASISSSLRSLSLWMESASLEDIIYARPPSAEGFRETITRPSPTSDLPATYQWVYERMTGIDPGEWASTSLHNELRWTLGLVPPPVPSAIMDSISYEEAELNRIIARRVIQAPSSTTGPVELLKPLQEQALTFLRQGRYREASALFEFYERQNPGNAIAKNNRGFCLIPESPDEALHHLQSPELNDYEPRSIAVYNQCCCYVSLGQAGRVLDLTEYYWQRELENDAVPGALWRFGEDGSWELYSESDARVAIARIAEVAAQRIGETERAAYWTGRLKSLAPS